MAPISDDESSSKMSEICVKLDRVIDHMTRMDTRLELLENRNSTRNRSQNIEDSGDSHTQLQGAIGPAALLSACTADVQRAFNAGSCFAVLHDCAVHK